MCCQWDTKQNCTFFQNTYTKTLTFVNKHNLGQRLNFAYQEHAGNNWDNTEDAYKLTEQFRLAYEIAMSCRGTQKEREREREVEKAYLHIYPTSERTDTREYIRLLCGLDAFSEALVTLQPILFIPRNTQLKGNHWPPPWWCVEQTERNRKDVYVSCMCIATTPNLRTELLHKNEKPQCFFYVRIYFFFKSSTNLLLVSIYDFYFAYILFFVCWILMFCFWDMCLR